MKNIREAIHDVIERVLPWIERDGIGNLLLPEQITPADCDKSIRRTRPCNVRNNQHELAIGLTGKAPHCIDGKTFIFTPGRMVLVPAGTPQASIRKKVRFTTNLDPDEPSSVLWILTYSFGAPMQFVHVANDTHKGEQTWPQMFLGRHFSGLLTHLLEEVRSRPPNYAFVGRCILLEFMARCLRATAESNDSALTTPILHKPPDRLRHRPDKTVSEQLSSRVQAAREFIQSRYHFSITVDDIAEAADASVTHLSRQFKSATGISLVQYLLEVRMGAARQLLMTDLKVSEVAILVGIEDANYFTRLFTRINGVSPRQYRRQTAKTA